MLGLVLWSDSDAQRAIVWCEDHGDLAYIGHCHHPAALPEGLDRGDLIQFDLTQMDDLRLATNPRRIARQYVTDAGAVLESAQAHSAEIELRQANARVAAPRSGQSAPPALRTTGCRHSACRPVPRAQIVDFEAEKRKRQLRG